MRATDATALDTLSAREDAGVDELVITRLRLDLVRQLPERPRRFLLRLALGYSYHEIATAEHASYSTTNKQIARAKRLLRELEDGGSSSERDPRRPRSAQTSPPDRIPGGRA